MTRDWLEDGGAIPDDDVLQVQLTTRQYFFHATRNAIMLESKEDMKAREGTASVGNASPDRADGLALTFALPVGPREIAKTRAELRGETVQDTEDAVYRPGV